MNILTESYPEALRNWPFDGQHIMAHQVSGQLVVYQAFKPAIADFAVESQCLGGADFSYDRMSWIKPNFLWMMYRCGWASKYNQERVLALWLDRTAFEEILGQAVFSAFTARNYDSSEAWKQELGSKPVRLQWDPDHDPYGTKVPRRAIQLGLKGEILEKFGKQQVTLIEDVTDFVRQQKTHVDNRQLELLQIPQEREYILSDQALSQKTGISALI